MAQNRAANAAQSLQRRQEGVGIAVARFFLWLTVGYGSSLVYMVVSAAVLFLWTTDLTDAIDVLVAYSLYCFVYIVVQIVSLIVTLYRTGGSMVRALADIGISLLPLVPIIILGTMTVMRGFAPTWLTYVVVVETVLTVAIDILAVLLFMRATQKTFETPSAHPAV